MTSGTRQWVEVEDGECVRHWRWGEPGMFLCTYLLLIYIKLIIIIVVMCCCSWCLATCFLSVLWPLRSGRTVTGCSGNCSTWCQSSSTSGWGSMPGSPCQSVLASCQVTDQSEIRSHYCPIRDKISLIIDQSCSRSRSISRVFRPETWSRTL